MVFWVVGSDETSAVFGRGDTITALKLFAQIGGGEAHLTGYVSNGHFGMVGQQVVGQLHADGVDVLGKGHAVGKGVKLVVQMMTTDAETLHNVLAHQVDLCIETFLTDDGVYGFKEVLVHAVFDFRLQN